VNWNTERKFIKVRFFAADYTRNKT